MIQTVLRLSCVSPVAPQSPASSIFGLMHQENTRNAEQLPAGLRDVPVPHPEGSGSRLHPQPRCAPSGNDLEWGWRGIARLRNNIDGQFQLGFQFDLDLCTLQ